MSKISTVVDNIESIIGALFPTYSALPFPEMPEANDTLFLKKGWGVAVGPGRNTNRSLSCKMSIERNLIITNTLALPNTYRDKSGRIVGFKQLLEDQFLILKEIEKNQTLNGIVVKTNFISDNGIEPIFIADNDSFRMIQSIYNVEYFEDLT